MYFNQFGIADWMQEFTVSSVTVELIAKTLSFIVDGHAVLIVTAGDAKIDNLEHIEQNENRQQNR